MATAKNIKKKKKKKQAKKNGFWKRLYRLIKQLVIQVNNYTTRTEENGPTREYYLFNRKVTFGGFMAIIAALLLVVVLASNDRSVGLDNSSLIVTGLPDSFENYKILLISDLAGENFGQEQSTLMRVINNLSYNCVVLCGDLLGESGNPKALYDLIEQLGTRRPVYFIAGDSDPSPLLETPRENPDGTLTLNQMVLSDWVLGAIDRGAIYLDSPQSIVKGDAKLWLLPETLLNLNVSDTLKVLKDEVEQETESMLVGIEDSYRTLPLTNYRYNVISKSADAIPLISAQDLIVMVAHEAPSDGQIIVSQRSLSAQELKSFFLSPDLILSGHYCGGEWKIPGLGAFYINAPLLPRYGWFPGSSSVEGARTVGSTIVYVTPGLSVNEKTLLPFRFMNPPRISLITLSGELPSSLLD